MLVEDNDANTVVVYDTTFTAVTTHSMPSGPRIRTCHGADKFYVARQTNPVVVRIVDSTGAFRLGAFCIFRLSSAEATLPPADSNER